jgi:glycosyltransferase involved in cell wall biosynthesis
MGKSNLSKESNFKIVFLAGTLEKGGAEKQLFLMAKSMLLNGHKVCVVVLGLEGYWTDELKKIGVDVKHIASKNKVSRIFQVHKIVKENNFEFLYSVHFYSSVYAGICGFLNRKLITIGSIRNDGRSEIIENGFWSYIQMRSCNFIIGNNLHGIDFVAKKFNINSDKWFYLGNSIETGITTVKQEPLMLPIKIVFIGRLEKQKDPLQLIEIAQELKSRLRFQITVLGTGSLEDTLKEEVKKNNLSEYFYLKGRVDNVIDYLFDSHLILSTSLHEGTPNAILEAISVGCVAVSRNFTGIESLLSEISTDYKNYIFKTTKEAANAVETMLLDTKKYQELKTAGIKFSSENWSTFAQYGKLISILSEMKKNKGAK